MNKSACISYEARQYYVLVSGKYPVLSIRMNINCSTIDVLMHMTLGYYMTLGLRSNYRRLNF